MAAAGAELIAWQNFVELRHERLHTLLDAVDLHINEQQATALSSRGVALDQLLQSLFVPLVILEDLRFP